MNKTQHQGKLKQIKWTAFTFSGSKQREDPETAFHRSLATLHKMDQESRDEDKHIGEFEGSTVIPWDQGK